MQERSPTNAIALLRQATWACHQRLEKRLDVKARFAHTDLYRTHLEKMWGFCAPLEQHFSVAAFTQALPDHELRRKLPLLLNDLRALGASDETVFQLPQCQAIPGCAELATAFGCAYVLEGATLGGRTLLPVVRKQLGYTAVHGAQFLAGYGERTTSMWHTFGAALDACCTTGSQRKTAAASAVATFEALELWLCGPTP